MSSPVSARKIGKLSAIYMIGSFAPQIIGVLLTPIFTRYLEPEQMGIVNQAVRLVVPLTWVIQLGFTAALKGDYFRLEPERRPSLVRTALVGQTVIAALIGAALLLVGLMPLGAETIAAQTFLPNLPLEMWQVYFVWTLVIAQAFCDALTHIVSCVAQLNERAAATVGIYFARYLLQAVLGLVVVVGLGWLGVGRQAAIVVGCAVAAAVAVSTVRAHARGSFDRTLFRRTFWGGMSFVPHALAGFMPQTVTSWLLGQNLGSRANGLFGAAQQLPQMTEVTLNAVNTAAYPTLANLMRDGGIQAKRQQGRVYTLLVLGVAGISLAVSVLSPIGIRILNAPSYYEAIDYAPILALAWLFMGLYLVVSQPVYFVGGGWWLSIASVAAAAVHFMVSVPLVHRHGLYGGAWSLVVGNFVLFAATATAGYRLYPLPWEYRKIVICLASAILLGAADIYVSHDRYWLAVLPVKLLLLAAWPVALRAGGVVSAEQFAQAAGWIRGKLRRRQATSKLDGDA